MTKGLVTIIVPVYNSEVCIDRCIGSLLNQSYGNLEIIMIDDGSTDASGEILDKYALTDSRFKVIHQMNAGVSSARNKGLEQAKGEWITFVDADDSLEKNYIKNLLPIDEDVQMTLCGMMRIMLDGRILKWEIYKDASKEIEIKRCSIQEIMTKTKSYALTGPMCKLFKNSIIQQNNLHFPLDMNFGEDSVFVFTYLLYVKNIMVINQWLYNYYWTEDSLSCKAESDERLLAVHRVYELSLRICKKNGIKELDSVQYHYVDGLMQVVGLENEPKIRYKCYDEIALLIGTNTVRLCMPFYFPLFARIRKWGVYEWINKLIYGKR